MQLKEKAAFKAIWQNPRGVKNRKTGGEKTEKKTQCSYCWSLLTLYNWYITELPNTSLKGTLPKVYSLNFLQSSNWLYEIRDKRLKATYL